jgi:hypothetical protein
VAGDETDMGSRLPLASKIFAVVEPQNLPMCREAHRRVENKTAGSMVKHLRWPGQKNISNSWLNAFGADED